MRNRKEQLNVRLTESESKVLARNADRNGLSKSCYIRMLVNGYVPRETPPREYGDLLRLMTEIYAVLKEQSAGESAGQLKQAILRLQAEVTLPERRESWLSPQSGQSTGR